MVRNTVVNDRFVIDKLRPALSSGTLFFRNGNMNENKNNDDDNDNDDENYSGR